jgi:outer membrane receptor protein involved in Fe transport
VSKEPAVFLGKFTDWVIGIYAREQDEKLLREYTYNAGDFSSDFDTHNQAIYTELNIVASKNLSVITGFRFENRRAEYIDNQDVNHNTDEGLWGGRFAIQYMVSPTSMVYGLISKGYKAGGVNSDPSLHPSDREFDTEFMWNIESGLKGSWMQEALSAQISVFYQKRKDIQIKQSLVQSRDDSNASDFIDYFGNSAKGRNYGLEIELNWSPTDRLSVFSSVGRLLTDYDTPLSVALDSREQAHAPSYQYMVGSRLQLLPNLLWIVEAEGKDKFYLSSSHNERSQSYRLANTSILYTTKDWTFSLWGRNLTDQDVIVRGFGGFGNDPRKYYAPEPYYQYGEPRAFGISSDYRF